MAFLSGADRSQTYKGSQPDFIWLDYLIMSDPQSVMKVLNNHGYTGYLAPMDESELTEVAYEFVAKKGDQAVIELLKAHPLYDAISDICKEESKVSLPYKNADGEDSNLVTVIKSVNYVRLIEAMLVVIGTFYLADLLWRKFFKTE